MAALMKHLMFNVGPPTKYIRRLQVALHISC